MINKSNKLSKTDKDEILPCVDSLVIWKTHQTKRLHKEKLKDGRTISRYIDTVYVTEYVDMSTGEILTPAQVKRLGIVEFDYKMTKLKQEAVLDKLRQEVKDFAVFLLKFRNKRRGISPSLEKVCEWYAEYTGKLVKNVNRYIEPLKQQGVLASDVLLMPVFQIPGRSTKASEHLQEDFLAESTFKEMMQRRAETSKK